MFDYIYMIVINGSIREDYGYFKNFEAAKATAAEIAAERGCEEYSWKSHELFKNAETVIGIEKIDSHDDLI